MSPSELAGILAAGAALGAAILRITDVFTGRANRNAITNRTAAETKATEQQVVSSEVTMLRGIISEVRDSESKKAERIDNLERRLDLLEERERHMLTRAAVHEAWDQMAFAILSQVNPEHPPPPPLTIAEHRDD